MKLSKEALILLSIISSTIGSNPCWNDNAVLSKSKDVSDVRSSCLCPPLYGYQFSDVLTRPKSEFERVVVFYYKDKTNNDVYMLTPGSDKQLSIPELSVDGSDDLQKLNIGLPQTPYDGGPSGVNVNTKNSLWYPASHHSSYLRPGKIRGPTPLNPQTIESTQGWQSKPVKPVGMENDYKLTDVRPQLPNRKTISYETPTQQNANYPQVPDAQYEQENGDDDRIYHMYNFKKWFKLHVEHFPELMFGDPQFISFNELNDQIVNVFNGNGFTILNNQVLNSRGEIVELDNYKLIRVTIKSETVNGNEEPNLTTNVDGVMLISVSPLTILGVVPFKRTFEDTNNINWNDKNKTNLNVKVNASNATVNEPTEYVTATEETVAVTPTTITPGNLDNLLKNLRNVFRRLVSPSPIELSRRDLGEGDLPSFRIIGGNAATGSGTPINSRGRSAAP